MTDAPSHIRELCGYYAGLSERQRLVFIARLANNLTTCIRAAYPTAAPGLNDDRRQKRLQALNEIMRLTTDHLVILLKDGREPYSVHHLYTDLLARAAHADSEESAVIEALLWAMRMSRV